MEGEILKKTRDSSELKEIKDPRNWDNIKFLTSSTGFLFCYVFNSGGQNPPPHLVLEWLFYSWHDFVTSHVGHLENMSSLTNADLTFHYPTPQTSHLLLSSPISSASSVRTGLISGSRWWYSFPRPSFQFVFVTLSSRGSFSLATTTVGCQFFTMTGLLNFEENTCHDPSLVSITIVGLLVLLSRKHSIPWKRLYNSNNCQKKKMLYFIQH